MWELFPKSVITGLESKVGTGHCNIAIKYGYGQQSRPQQISPLSSSPGQLYEQANLSLI